MKKTLSILFSILSLSIMAQVPQGVGYQGVATDANGIELVNQSISIRASVLSGSATGTIEWEETHATSTDTFGLFTLTIGQGTNTTNGLQTSFADISWGTNTYFLKIEMDVTGGSTYSNMGTNQMMSVPYALYAESANINYDSISNFLSGDSTFITTVGGGMGGDGCNFKYPDGLDGESITSTCTYSNPYIVPTNKRLIVLLTSNNTEINGVQLPQIDNGEVLILNSGDTFSPWNGIGDLDFNGILIEPKTSVTSITSTCTYSNPYIVPTNKRLIVLLTSNNTEINGVQLPQIDQDELLILNSGDTFSPWNGIGDLDFNGYLADENYFANCGGGSSSSTSSLDSTAIANMIAGAGGGCDFNYPDGLNGTPVIHDFENNGSYTVPAGKNFYTNMIFNNNSDDVLINSIKFHDSGTMNSSLNTVLSEGDVISMTYNGGNTPPHKNMFGLLVDKKVQSLSYDFLTNGPYTVPTGKELYIYRIYHNALRVEVNSLELANYNQLTMGSDDVTFSNHLILKAGDVIDIIDQGSGGWENMFGYLADENYFAGCGGGGGSSSTSSLDSTTIANMIAGAGGGCDFNYPDGLVGEVINLRFSLQSSYTVPSGKTLYVTNFFGDDPSCYMAIDFNNINGAPQIINGVSNYRGIQGNNVPGLLLPIIVGEGETLSGGGGNASCNGLLVDKGVTPITWQLGWGSYTVPIGKKLYILNSNDNGSGQSSYFYIDDGNGNQTIQNGPTNSTETNSFGIPLILGENTILSGNPTFNGYLVDENYFAGCGGGGGSSSSSATTNNQINNYNNILNQSVTSGTFNYLYASYPTNLSYTVPAGKIMKITDWGSTGSSTAFINSQQWSSSMVLPSILSEGTQIEIQLNASGNFINLQYDLIDNTQGVTLNYMYASSPTNFSYTVPAGKIMKITTISEDDMGTPNPTLINGQLWSNGTDLPSTLSEGTQIEIQFNNSFDFINLQYILFDN